jgi:RNA binding exosome subunit
MQKNSDLTKTVGYIDIRVFAHATEDSTKVQTAVKNLLTPELGDTIVFEQTSLEGHHRNSITVFTAKLTDKNQLPLTLQKIGQGLSALDREALANDIQLHLEKCNLYLRFDKQSAFCGNFKFTKNDPIHFKIHFKDKTQDEIIDFSRQMGLLP